ncbi:MAG TPA: ABC transporter substrate-binding protein [Trueperaceae bacterium]|nr:ABC transporter substrate-binding protein [Trueperaceae bacterium]
MRFRWLLLAALAASGLALAQNNVLTIGTTDSVTELSPANSYDFFTWNVLAQTSEGLVKLQPGGTQIEPSLATSWDISSDGLTYTFHLRQGVTFTDGSPMNAQAVKWSFDRALKLDGPKGAVGLIKGDIKSIATPDDSTVVFTLNQPDATFLARMAPPISPVEIMSPKSTPADSFAKGKYAGTGPYKLVSYVPNQRVVLEAYSGYWGPQPKEPRVIYNMYSDASALRSALQSGAIDIGYRSFNPQDVISLEKDQSFKEVKPSGSLSIRYLLFNVTQKPFDNATVRQAISYAVDRQAIVSDVFSGINKPLYSMVPPGMWSSIDVFPKRDVEKAKQLLQQAGYSSSNPLDITLWYPTGHYGSTEPDVAAVLKTSLEQTGMMQVKLSALDWGTYDTRMSQGALGFFTLGWYPDFIDPDNFLAPWLTDSTHSLGTFWDKAPDFSQYKDLITKARASTDQSTRAADYQQVQKLSAQDVPFIPLWQNFGQLIAFTKPNVSGMVIDPAGNWLLDTVTTSQ